MAVDLVALEGRVLGGQGGDGVLLESIAFKFDKDKTTNEETAVIELSGTAHTVLRDKWNPLAGFDDLPEPVPVKENVKVAVAEGKKADNDILFQILNRRFEFDPPLEDREGEWERFTEDGKDSIYNQLIGQPVFFKVGKNGFFNVAAMAQRKEAKMDAVADKIKTILKAKKDKAEAKAKAEADLMSSGVGGDDPPF